MTIKALLLQMLKLGAVLLAAFLGAFWLELPSPVVSLLGGLTLFVWVVASVTLLVYLFSRLLGLSPDKSMEKSPTGRPRRPVWEKLKEH